MRFDDVTRLEITRLQPVIPLFHERLECQDAIIDILFAKDGQGSVPDEFDNSASGILDDVADEFVLVRHQSE